jgi:hypothetical protein
VNKLKNRILIVIIFIFTGINLLGIAFRLFFGVDYVDEVYALAMAKKLSLGEHLFSTEIDIHQTYSVYAMPFYNFLKIVFSSTDGLVLLMRAVFLSFIFFFMYLFFKKYKNSENRLFLILLCIFAVGYIPYSNVGLQHLPLNYYLFLPIMLMLQFNLIKNKFVKEFLIGVFGGICVVGYPSLIFAFFIYIFARIISRMISKKEFLAFISGAVVGVGPALYYLFPVDWQQIGLTLKFSALSLYPLFSTQKLFELQYHSKNFYWLLLGFPFGFILNLTRLNKCKEFVIMAVLLCLSLYYIVTFSEAAPIEQLMTVAGLFLLGVYFSERPKVDYLKKSLLWLILPAILITSLSSSFLGLLGLSWGLVVLTVPLFYRLYERASSATHKSYLTFALLAISTSITVNKTFYFWEDYRTNKIAQVLQGPYKYLFTTEVKFNYLQNFDQLVSGLSETNTVFIYYNFPAGYLLTKAKPMTNLIWPLYQFQEKDEVNKLVLKPFVEQSLRPDYVLEMKYYDGRRRVRYTFEVPKDNSIKIFFKDANYLKLKENDIGILYTRHL